MSYSNTQGKPTKVKPQRKKYAEKGAPIARCILIPTWLFLFKIWSILICVLSYIEISMQ